MSLSAVSSPIILPGSERYLEKKSQGFDNNSGLPRKNYSVNATMVSEYYSSQSLSFEYTSKDGDTVSFSMESVEYGKSVLDVAAEGGKEDMKKLVDYIKDTFSQMRREMIRGFLKSVGAEVPEDRSVEEKDSVQELQIPEYWNAENTSQRIVDFAVSFMDIFEGSGNEFLDTIKSAIEEGFKQAREMLGELDDQVSSLIDDTYSLVMDKLDAWGKEQGILSEEVAENA